MEHILQPNEIGNYSRPISSRIDANALDAYIGEVERVVIIPAIGYDKFANIIENPSDNELLVHGGEYERDGKKYLLAGLKKCIAYYTFAKVMRGNEVQLTRYGAMEKQAEYSSHASSQNKTAVYGEIVSIADSYLREIVNYLGNNNHISTTRTRYRVLGN